MNIVGIGGAGCAFVSQLEKYPQYNVYKIDKGLPRKGRTYPITPQATSEEYEANPPKLNQFMTRMEPSKSVTVVMAGGGATSGASLKILEQFHKKYRGNVNLVYIKPDVSSLSEICRLQDRICYRVLQEYTRSGVFSDILLISNPHLEECIGQLPVKNYYENLNNFLTYCFNIVNVFKNTDSEISSSKGSRSSHVRIFTIGTVDLDKEEEKLFFPLENIEMKEYYYGIKSERIEEDTTLLAKVRKMSSKTSATSSYSIHETSYEKDVGYVVAWTSKIQVFPEATQNSL